MTKRIVVLISGNGSNLQAIIDNCNDKHINGEVVAVISNKAAVYGIERAAKANIPCEVLDHKAFVSRNEYDQALMAVIDQFKPDLIILAGFMRILTPELVQHYQGKMLNVHPSLLPKYQGLNTHQRAIDAGDTEHGVSVHFVTEELDGGPVVLQAKVPVFPEDNADDLAQRVHQHEHRIFPLVAQWFCTDRLSMQQQGNDFVAYLDDKPLPAQGYASD
ncbi:MAG: phosphoribosylglycinamide formyltransferase [Gammaproteobacteria bacterium]|nr:phosphoribosylglycinamide formyltransferase [Gammaproteobacteria bacterium]